MRKIKFRAWDKRNKKFIIGDCFSINRNGKIDAVTWKDWEYSENPDDFILNEFTGLKDKNGKEIYEEDIIKWSNGLKYEVYFRPQEGWNCGTLCEIIGNIYENPELLEGK